jgi:hypothetical protein
MRGLFMAIQQTSTGPKTEPVLLKRKIKYSRGTPRAYIPVGILGLLMETGFMVTSSGVLSGPLHPLREWLPWTLIFGCAGVLLIGHGLSMRRREARRAAAGEAARLEPWLYDRKWNAQGGRDNSGDHLGFALFMLAFMAAMTLGFVWMDSRSSMPVEVYAVIGLMGLISLGLIGWVVRILLQRRRFGVAQLHFEQFPFFMGELLEARFEPGWGNRPIDVLRIILRCVQEGAGSEKAMLSSDGQTVCWQIYADAVNYYNVGAVTPGRGVAVTFQLPDRPDRANDFFTDFVRYWEIEVEATSGSKTYQGRFLVPVYARPGAK